ncbi:MAG TPA: hypothetical protein VFP53_05560 [Sphingomicrobium sp.]|nr:hypothetical protein [Sphingomicrobium sp.]
MKKLWIYVAAGAIAGFGFAGVAAAQSTAQKQPTPKGWNWEIKDGKRVPKGKRVTNADGSWREEIRQGKCTTVKEMSAAGVYKETHNCGSGGS